jgi:phosphatidylinositol alpha-1,6-mannosyltransferase
MTHPPLLVTVDYPPRLGGVAEYLRNVAATCGPMEVWAPAEDGGEGSEEGVRRMRMERAWLRPRWLPLLVRVLWKCARPATRPRALVVSHVLPVGIAAKWARRLFGVPYAVIVHGYDVALVDAGSPRKRRRGAAVLAAADLVVANAHNTAAIVRRLGVADGKLVVCHPCPATAVTAVAPRTTSPVLRGLTAGRFTTRKAIDVVLRALVLLRERGITCSWTLVGDGPERAHIEQLIVELGLSGMVRYVGRKSPQELAALYGEADVFALVPRDLWPDFESFGMVYLEAAQRGVPSVASATGGIPEAVLDGETGLLVPPDHPAALADALERLAKDPALRERLGERGRERAAAEFTWERTLRPLREWLANARQR